MLKEIFRDALEERNISARQAAREIGVSHTTVSRMLNGEIPAYTTLAKIADWLGTTAEALVLIDQDGGGSTAVRLNVFLDRHPELKKPLDDVMEAYNQGDIDDSDVKDIIGFINYRLGMQNK